MTGPKISRLRALLLDPGSEPGEVVRVYADRLEIATAGGVRSIQRTGATAFAAGDRVMIQGGAVTRSPGSVVVRV